MYFPALKTHQFGRKKIGKVSDIKAFIEVLSNAERPDWAKFREWVIVYFG
jgi:hypothetical protein